jgi:hypothetical protein
MELAMSKIYKKSKDCFHCLRRPSLFKRGTKLLAQGTQRALTMEFLAGWSRVQYKEGFVYFQRVLRLGVLISITLEISHTVWVFSVVTVFGVTTHTPTPWTPPFRLEAWRHRQTTGPKPTYVHKRQMSRMYWRPGQVETRKFCCSLTQTDRQINGLWQLQIKF